MMLTTLLQAWALTGAVMAAPPGDTRALIEKALSEPTKISLENISLGSAIQMVTEQTGVRIVMGADVMRLVPQGAETLIQKVDIANIPLRDGLTRLFSPLGMIFVVENDHVEIIPKEALLCLGRPATWAELELLGELSAMQPGLDANALGKLQGRVQFQVPQPMPWNALAAAIRAAGAGPGDEVLTIACNNLGWAWCLSDQRIVIAPFEQQIRRRLQQRVSVRMNNRALFDVMQAVGEEVNVNVRVEPGSLTSLPSQVQKNFSLNVQQRTAEEALEAISAGTGLGYAINPDGVMFYRVDSGGGQPPSNTAGPSASDPYVAKISIPLEGGRAIEWLIRRSELPEDLRQMREHDLQAFIAEFRQRATAGGQQ